ncbi:MAG: sensor domain-containing diguanylate cyclase [Clostridiales bacterium]|nr:sensor domain-containing diguanylate cyclase [Clostridiales bacterium]
MDFERLLSGYMNKTCIMSVDKLPDDHYGNIRIAAGNKAHCDDMFNVMHRPFVPDSPYEEYFPQNRNFEDFCYRCAILGQPLHTYVELPQMGLWLNMFLLPLESDKENTGYCIYSYEVTPHADSEQRASLSADTSSAVLQTCIKLRASGDIHDTFHEVVEDIRQICESDYCCILLTDNENCTCKTLAESIEPGSGLLPMDSYLDEKFFDITRTWNATLGDSTCLILKDQHDMDWLKAVNPVWHKSLTKASVRNIVLFPLNHNDVTLGYMWSINFNVDNTVKIKETLELTTFFIASEIANYQLLQRLELMSTMDMLTGVKNRNAMNNTISDVIKGKIQIVKPYSVIFADLNGLKRVNDENGHDKGDNLLRRAATILRDAFPGAEVYRAGGDEFMIISPDTNEAKLQFCLRDVETKAVEKNVHFAIGTFIVSGDEDIRTAMRVADERMYGSKKAYYEAHPERKYR